MKKNFLKKSFFFFRSNYFIPIFLFCLFFVGIIVFSKLFFSTPTYIYVQIKVGQGYWWGNTARPSQWLANAIKKGDTAKDILGQTTAQIVSVRRYPNWGNNQFDVNIIVKLKVNENKKTGLYSFNRSSIAIGSPIQIEFPNVDLTGAITNIQQKPITDTYVNKTVLLMSQGGYTKDFPFRYDSIIVGDKYFDGEEYVVEILEKKLEKNIWTIPNNLNGQTYEQTIDTTQNILVKAKIRVKKVNNEFYFADEYKLNANASIPISTANSFFEGFVVRKIE